MSISSDSIFFLIKWCRPSIGFVRRWNSGLAMSKMSPLLSAIRPIGWPSSLYPSAAKNLPIHKATFSASVVAMYFASEKKRATVACSFNWYDTGSPERRKAFPHVDFSLSLGPARSESVYRTSLSVALDWNGIPSSKVPANYRKVSTTKLQCMGPDLHNTDWELLMNNQYLVEYARRATWGSQWQIDNT